MSRNALKLLADGGGYWPHRENADGLFSFVVPNGTGFLIELPRRAWLQFSGRHTAYGNIVDGVWEVIGQHRFDSANSMCVMLRMMPTNAFLHIHFSNIENYAVSADRLRYDDRRYGDFQLTADEDYALKNVMRTFPRNIPLCDRYRDAAQSLRDRKIGKRPQILSLKDML